MNTLTKIIIVFASVIILALSFQIFRYMGFRRQDNREMRSIKKELDKRDQFIAKQNVEIVKYIDNSHAEIEKKDLKINQLEAEKKSIIKNNERRIASLTIEQAREIIPDDTMETARLILEGQMCDSLLTNAYAAIEVMEGKEVEYKNIINNYDSLADNLKKQVAIRDEEYDLAQKEKKDLKRKLRSNRLQKWVGYAGMVVLAIIKVS